MEIRPMRLRQIALVAKDLTHTAAIWTELLSAEICFRDPEVGFFGLENVLIPLGSDFLEIVSPVRTDTAGHRHLSRRGPGGYMVLFQCADGLAAREQALAAGAEPIWEHDKSGIHATHFHPRSLPGAIVSVDSMEENDSNYQRPDSRWHWAGPDWKTHKRENGILRLSGVQIDSKKPEHSLQLWQNVLNLPCPSKQRNALSLDHGIISFTKSESDDARLVAFQIEHSDPKRVLDRARGMGLTCDGMCVQVTGVQLEIAQGTR